MSSFRRRRTTRPSITIPADPDTDRDDDDKELEDLIERLMPDLAVQRKNLFMEQAFLGKGACSVVHRARHMHTRELFAIKTFNLYDKERARQLVRELSTLGGCSCPSLVGFYGVYKYDDSIHVVLEYMDRGSLHDVIHNAHHDCLPEGVIAAITFQILWGLAYLHYEHKLHRDVKPSNILVNAFGEVKLTDFGIAKELREDEMAQTCVGTFRYMSPERLRGESYGAAADIWSLGLVLIELATRRTPFLHCSNQIDLNQLLEETNIDNDLIPHSTHSEHFCEFVSSCLRPRPDQRLPAAVLLESPLFAHHGIEDLDMAMELFKEWLDDNPIDADRSAIPPGLLHYDATQAPCMVSTWKSSDGESSEGEAASISGSFRAAGALSAHAAAAAAAAAANGGSSGSSGSGGLLRAAPAGATGASSMSLSGGASSSRALNGNGYHHHSSHGNLLSRAHLNGRHGARSSREFAGVATASLNGRLNEAREANGAGCDCCGDAACESGSADTHGPSVTSSGGSGASAGGGGGRSSYGLESGLCPFGGYYRDGLTRRERFDSIGSAPEPAAAAAAGGGRYVPPRERTNGMPLPLDVGIDDENACTPPWGAAAAAAAAAAASGAYTAEYTASGLRAEQSFSGASYGGRRSHRRRDNLSALGLGKPESGLSLQEGLPKPGPFRADAGGISPKPRRARSPYK